MLGRKLLTSKKIVTISQYNKQYLLKKYGKALESKIHIIHCGIDVEKFRPRAAKKGTVPIILAVGALTEVKGFAYLVEACSIMKKNGYSFKCLIVGEGEDREVLNRKSSSVKADDIVVFLGRQLQEKVLKLLEATTIFCLPSIITDKGGREGIPVALMEAMAMELPVVSTRTVGIPELIRHQREGLLVPQKDPVSLASAAILGGVAAENKELRIAMGSAARKKVMKDFNIANIPKSFETIFS
jgi:glycosyltransferase involved in cell wall biosynthesis